MSRSQAKADAENEKELLRKSVVLEAQLLEAPSRVTLSALSSSFSGEVPGGGDGEEGEVAVEVRMSRIRAA